MTHRPFNSNSSYNSINESKSTFTMIPKSRLSVNSLAYQMHWALRMSCRTKRKKKAALLHVFALSAIKSHHLPKHQIPIYLNAVRLTTKATESTRVSTIAINCISKIYNCRLSPSSHKHNSIIIFSHNPTTITNTFTNSIHNCHSIIITCQP